MGIDCCDITCLSGGFVDIVRSTHRMETKLQVVDEESSFRALNKPSGLSVLKDNTGAACLYDLYSDRFGEKPLMVHRIDKGASGLLLVARTDEFRSGFSRLLAERGVEKIYLALVDGVPAPPEGLIDAPLEKARKGKYRIAESGGGYASQTEYETLSTGDGQTLLVAHPLTGRSHQIRVHLASIGHPLVRDPLYGRERRKPSLYPELTLHAWRLKFVHPVEERAISIEAPAPEWAKVPLGKRDLQ